MNKKKRLSTVVSVKQLLNSKLAFFNEYMYNHVYLNYLFNSWVLEICEVYKNINRCNKYDFRRVCKVYLLDDP